MLKPVKKQSLSDAVFEQLREQIVGGHIEPGEQLPAERALCEKLGVNRGALREALKRLEQAGLVSIQHGGATKVLNFRQTASMDLLSQLLLGPTGAINIAVARSVVEMRSALAPDIARLAALRREPAQAERLDTFVGQMEAATGDLPKLQSLSLDFWGELVELSGNLAYRLAFNTMRQVYTKLWDVLTHTLSAEFTHVAGYRTLAAAVADGDPTRAAKKARELIELSAVKLLEVIDAVEALGKSSKKTKRKKERK